MPIIFISSSKPWYRCLSILTTTGLDWTHVIIPWIQNVHPMWSKHLNTSWPPDSEGMLQDLTIMGSVRMRASWEDAPVAWPPHMGTPWSWGRGGMRTTLLLASDMNQQLNLKYNLVAGKLGGWAGPDRGPSVIKHFQPDWQSQGEKQSSGCTLYRVPAWAIIEGGKIGQFVSIYPGLGFCGAQLALMNLASCGYLLLPD